MKQQLDQRAIFHQRDIAEQQSLTEYRRHDRDVHGIPDVAIHSGNRQMARRESGRRRADSLECEAAEAFQQSCEPWREENSSHKADQRESDEGPI